MPIYEYVCDKCGKTFDQLKSVGERERPGPCPECGSRGAKRRVSSVADFRPASSVCSPRKGFT